MTDTISTSIRLTLDLRQRIKKAAHRSEMSQSEFITLALEIQIAKALQEAKP